MAIDYQAILDTYRDLHQQANKANRRRYRQMLDTIRSTNEQVGQTYDTSLALLENLGQTDLARIDMSAARRQAESEQDLISRGLGNTTIRESAKRGIEADAELARQGVTERVGAQKAGVMQSRAGAEQQGGQFLAQMMERRTDQGPDLNQLSQLLQQAGAAEAQQQDGAIFTGMSANARAGRDAFGRPFQYTGSGGGGAASPSFGDGGGGGGSGGGGAYVIRNAANQVLSSFGGGGGGAGGGGGVSTVGGGGASAQQIHNEAITGGQAFLGDQGHVGGTDMGPPGQGDAEGEGEGDEEKGEELVKIGRPTNFGHDFRTVELPASEAAERIANDPFKNWRYV